MTREEYINMLNQEQFGAICFKFYQEKNQKKHLDLAFEDFLKLFKVYPMHQHVDIIKEVIDYYNREFEVMKIFGKDNKIIAYT